MKTIVILSSEPWGKMMLSKMHYARELSEMGNNVYFVEPPRKLKTEKPVEKLVTEKNLTIIRVKEHPLRVFAREKCYPVFKRLEKKYVETIRKVTGDIDELWCFNPHFISDIDLFHAEKTLLFVYDLYKGKNLQTAARKSDAIITVAQNILDEFKDTDKPKLLIHHGLAPAFEKQTLANVIDTNVSSPVRIGYVGNLLRGAIDIPVFEQLIEAHPDIEFHFWGPTGLDDNNVSGKTVSGELIVFNSFLQAQSNVFLHGVKAPEELAVEIQRMDGFLFVYSQQRDMNAASNSHKLMEYLSTGKPVISYYVSSYEDTGLLVMPEKGKIDFIVFLNSAIKKMKEYNSEELQKKRINFALNNTYAKQVERIHSFIG